MAAYPCKLDIQAPKIIGVLPINSSSFERLWPGFPASFEDFNSEEIHSIVQGKFMSNGKHKWRYWLFTKGYVTPSQQQKTVQRFAVNWKHEKSNNFDMMAGRDPILGEGIMMCKKFHAQSWRMVKCLTSVGNAWGLQTLTSSLWSQKWDEYKNRRREMHRGLGYGAFCNDDSIDPSWD